MVVRRATVEDWEEDQEEALAVSAAAAAAAAAENSALGSGTMNAGGGRSSGSSSSSLGERVAWYAKVLLVTAIVGFKIAEWWTRVESEAREIYYFPRAVRVCAAARAALALTLFCYAFTISTDNVWEKCRPKLFWRASMNTFYEVVLPSNGTLLHCTVLLYSTRSNKRDPSNARRNSEAPGLDFETSFRLPVCRLLSRCPGGIVLAKGPASATPTAAATAASGAGRLRSSHRSSGVSRVRRLASQSGPLRGFWLRVLLSLSDAPRPGAWGVPRYGVDLSRRGRGSTV